jgi:ABC-type lipoprotein release transport system permease subunit
MVASTGSVKIERQISLPLNQAFKIALRNITIRLGRAMITGAGTMLGIAFLMSVFTARLVLEASGQTISMQQEQKNTWLVVMSLLVSVVGITNSMLMSVTERYKEIGTMKCLGALDNFIVKLFLLESGMLGFFGALLGAFIGALFMMLTNLTQRVPEGVPNAGDLVLAHLNWAGLIGKLLICVLIGGVLSIIGAVFPSMRAARMQPADAMRSEI